jgi:hypothetical protein
VLGQYHIPLGQQGGAFHRVTQLTHIARPGVPDPD